MTKFRNSLKKGLVFTLALSLSFSYSSMRGDITKISAATNQSGTTTIYPNKLVIQWESEDNSVSIDTFRIFGYNVAQLRTVVNTLNGTVNKLSDNTYQIEQTSNNKANYSDIAFKEQTVINYKINVSQIRDNSGTLTAPEEPGWVFLPEYNYNWGSIRDVIDTLGLVIISYDDNPTLGFTKIVIGQPTILIDEEKPLGAVDVAKNWPAPLPPSTPSMPIQLAKPTDTPTPTDTDDLTPTDAPEPSLTKKPIKPTRIPKPTIQPVDYSALEAAIAKAEAFVNGNFAGYTKESVDAAKDWVNAKLSYLYSLRKADTQEAVDSGILAANNDKNIAYAEGLLVKFSTAKADEAIVLGEAFLDSDFSAYTDDSVAAAKKLVNDVLEELYSLLNNLNLDEEIYSQEDFDKLVDQNNIAYAIEDANELLVLKSSKSDGQKAAELLAGLSKDEISNGLSLSGGVMKLVVGDMEFILKTDANNLNQQGEIDLGDGYFLVFDITGNGSNIKDFTIVKR